MALRDPVSIRVTARLCPSASAPRRASTRQPGARSAPPLRCVTDQAGCRRKCRACRIHRHRDRGHCVLATKGASARVDTTASPL